MQISATCAERVQSVGIFIWLVHLIMGCSSLNTLQRKYILLSRLGCAQHSTLSFGAGLRCQFLAAKIIEVCSEHLDVWIPTRAQHEVCLSILRLAQDESLRLNGGDAARGQVASFLTGQACVNSYVGLNGELKQRAAAEY